jgi:DNA-binding NtrC family response regulator
MNPVTILLVDDERPLRASLRRLLTPEGFQVLEAADGREAMVMVARSVGAPVPPGPLVTAETEPAEVPPIDIVISDLRMPEANGIEVLRYVRQVAPHIEMLLLTAFGEVTDAVTALRLGAFNFLEKPFEPEALLLEVKRAQLLAIERRGKPAKKAVGPKSYRLVGDAPVMKELNSIISRVAPSEATVLILGESGTGKELVARAIHDHSLRAKGPFVAVHCGAIPESLFESELFGHVKGSFTGAVGNRDGRFAQADGGTIFLDEIGEMPLAMQVKLLRVLQEKTFEPVGSSKARRGDFRVLAATNRDLSKAVAGGTFRQDLFYRLNVVPIEVPALRERASDIPALCASFVSIQNQQRATAMLPPDTACMELLRRYPWPGNVRELEHLIERIAVLKGEGAITENDLPAVIRETAAIGIQRASISSQPSAPRSVTMNLNGELNRLEVELIRTALEQSGGNKNRASQVLGLNRTTLIEKIKRLGLQAFADSLNDTPTPGAPKTRPDDPTST